MRTMRRAVLVLALVAGVVVVGGPRAIACSCALGDPRTRLAQSPGAVVGTVQAIGAPRQDGRSVFRLKVEQAVKGRLGPTVDVLGHGGGDAGCGLSLRLGDRAGLFLGNEGGAWTASLCSHIEPDLLAAAARPMPEPDGVPPVAMLAAVEWGDVRVVALDGSGRTVSYGRGGPVLQRLAVCPGGRFVVGHGPPFVVREVASMRLQSEAAATANLPDGGNVTALGCLHERGDEIAFFASTMEDPIPRGEVVLLRNGRVAGRYSGAWKAASFYGRTVYLSGGTQGHTIESLDLATGRVRPVAQIARVAGNPHVGQAVASPDGRWLAAVAWVPWGGRGASQSRALLVDMRATPPEVLSSPLPRTFGDGRVGWLDAGRFLVATQDGESVVFDADLRRLGVFRGWFPHESVVSGSVTLGVSDGALLAASLPSGPIRRVRTFDTTVTNTVAVIPGIRIAASSGPIVPPPTDEPVIAEGTPQAAPGPSGSGVGVVPVVLFAALFLGTPLTILLLRRRKPEASE